MPCQHLSALLAGRTSFVLGGPTLPPLESRSSGSFWPKPLAPGWAGGPSLASRSILLGLPPSQGGLGCRHVTQVVLKKADAWSQWRRGPYLPLGALDLEGVSREPRMATWPPHGERPSVRQISDLEKFGLFASFQRLSSSYFYCCMICMWERAPIVSAQFRAMVHGHAPASHRPDQVIGHLSAPEGCLVSPSTDDTPKESC